MKKINKTDLILNTAKESSVNQQTGSNRNCDTFESVCICVSDQCVTENNDTDCQPYTDTSGLGQFCCPETGDPANCPVQETTGCPDTEQCMLSIEICPISEDLTNCEVDSRACGGEI